jgi:hypothetical protein
MATTIATGKALELLGPMRIGFDSFHRLGMLLAPNSESVILWQS